MPAGALIAFLEPGPNTPVEVEDARPAEIFATEHLPPVTKLPEFTRGAAYRTADGGAPSWGAVFTLSDIGVLQTPAVHRQESAREQAMLADLAAVDRRVLLLLTDSSPSDSFSPSGSISPFASHAESEYSAARAEPEPEPGNAIALVGLKPDVGAWVLDGHNALIESVPGWLRTRTFQLVSAIAIPAVEGRPMPQLVALHEFQSADALQTQEFLEAAPSDHEELQVRTAILCQVL